FEWEGRTVKGEVKYGALTAGSELELRTLVRREGIILVKSKEKKEEKTGRYSLRKKVKQAHIGVFTRQLATMITSGLPLVQSLEALSQQLDDGNLRLIVKNIKQKIEEGVRFADALRDYPKCFDDLYINLILAGEEGGNLESVLMRIASYIEKTEKLKKKVKSALIYPASIITVAIAVVMILLLFVIPVFEGMFSSFGKALPAPTQMVINLSKFVKSSIHFIIAGVIVGVFLLRRYYRTDVGARQLDALLLRVPVLGLLLKKASLARVTRTLSTLLSSGIAILESLVIVAKTAGNKVIEEALVTARTHISQGRSISEPLKESGVFPPMVIQMIQVGETTGALDAMLNKVADFYEDDVDEAVTNLTALLEPALMVFLGIVLGGLIVAMYLPIFQLGSVVG
ncbi:MAG TPA: type II secretion system F family protein, partial [Syntrophorhabdales bacterium]|nr:type II secretion system F family protein [Syntrophorhabdales bacterium]